MAKMGLLGALGGFGEFLSKTGSDMAARRERALENARRMAEEERKYQRTRRDTVLDREDQQDHQLTELGIREKRADARTTATLAATAANRREDREFRRTERIEGQKYRTSERIATQGERRELAKLQSSLQGARTDKEIRLREQLSADDVHAVQYGEPDARGYAEVMVVTKSGAIRSTGKRVYRPKKPEDEEGGEAL